MLLFIVTLKYFFSEYKSLCSATWVSWALIIILALVSLFFTEVFTKTAKGVYDLMRGSFLFFVAAIVASNFRMHSDLAIVRLFFVSASFLIFLSYLSLAILSEGMALRGNPIITYYFSGIHEYANVAAIVLVGLFSLWVADKRSFSLLHFISVLFLLFVLVMTDSRGAYLALMLCLLYPLCYVLPSLKLLWWALALFVLISFFYISYFHVGTTIFGHDIPFSFLERIRLSVGTAEAIFEAPWFGYGLNTYKFISDELGFKDSFVMPHNIYLELVFSVGLIGGFIVLLALLQLMMLNQRYPSLTISTNRFWAIFSQLLLIYLSFRGLTELKLGFKTWGMLMICLGIMAGLKLRKELTKSQYG